MITKYKIGDYVIINENALTPYEGKIGKINDISDHFRFPYRVFFSDKGSRIFSEDGLKLAPQCETPLWKKMNGIKE